MPPDVNVSAPLPEWLAGLAAPSGNPGGGAAGGVVLAMAAALCEMVAGYPAAEAEHRGRLVGVIERSRQCRERALTLADADGQASLAFAATYRLADGPARVAAVASASLAAADSAAAIVDEAVTMLDDIAELEATANRRLTSDVLAAGALLRAVLAGARANIAVDLGAIEDSHAADHAARMAALRATLDGCSVAVARIDATLLRLDEQLTAPR